MNSKNIFKVMTIGREERERVHAAGDRLLQMSNLKNKNLIIGTIKRVVLEKK